MLRFLNRNMIAEQHAQSRCLSEHADSLAARNVELNRQLQSLIRQIDGNNLKLIFTAHGILTI